MGGEALVCGWPGMWVKRKGKRVLGLCEVKRRGEVVGSDGGRCVGGLL